MRPVSQPGAAGFGRLARQFGGDPAPARRAAVAPRAQRAGRCRRRAHGRPEVEQRLREIRRPGAGLRVGAQPLAPPRAIAGRRPAAAPSIGENPRRHPLHIAVHRHPRHAERNGRDRRGGVGPMPGNARSAADVAREAAERGHRPSAGMQVAGAGIVAEPGPGGITSSSGAAASAATSGKRVTKRLIVGYDRGDRGLLQHDLAAARPGTGRPPRPAAPARAGGGDGGRTRPAAPAAGARGAMTVKRTRRARSSANAGGAPRLRPAPGRRAACPG